MTLTTWARRAYLAGIVLGLLLFLPQTWFPLMAAKVAAAAVLFLLAAVLYALAWWRGTAEAPPKASLWLILLPLVYGISFIFSADRALGVMGAGIGFDTLYFTTLLAATGIVGAALFRGAADAWMFMRVVLISTTLAAVFQFCVLAGVPGLFSDHSTNLIGKWNDFGLLVGLVAFLLLISIETGRAGLRGRIVAWVGLAAALVLLALVNFPTSWGILLVAAVCLAAAVWVGHRRVAWGALVAAAVAVVFLFFGAALNTQLAKVIPVSSLEVRPSLQSTYAVTTAAHGASVSHAALGTGPNTFGLSWLTFKPAEVNQSLFWNLDFVVGYSTLATAFSTVGLSGALMWLLPLVLVLAALWRARAGERALLAWTLGASVLMWWGMLALYVPSVNMLLVAFAFVGVALGALSATHTKHLSRPLSGLLALVLVVALLWGAAAGVRRVMAQSYEGMSSAALSAGDIDGALHLAGRSVAIEPMPENLRLVTSADASKISQLSQATSSSAGQQAADLLKSAVASAERAVALDPQDYLSYMTIGQLYELMVPLKITGAYDSAHAAYAKAAELSPLNPSIPLLMARLESEGGTQQGLADALKKSLTLKPDYTDAILFLAQVDIARQDLASAIRDTQVAAQTAPGVPSIWLQLGLLYYAGGDTKQAIPPLEQAIKIQPDYANAQYFLGLAYDAQGRAQDALALFNRLNQTNPGNAQIQLIVSNIQSGKPALSTSTPATTR